VENQVAFVFGMGNFEHHGLPALKVPGGKQCSHATMREDVKELILVKPLTRREIAHEARILASGGGRVKRTGG